MTAPRLAMAAALFAATLLAGCTSPTPPIGPTSTASESATLSPSASPSASASATPGPSEVPPTPVPPPAPAPMPQPPGPQPATPSSIPAALLGTDVERIPTSARVVALTFDAGASDAAVSSILATLAAKGVPATFFLTGDFARHYPGQVAAIAAAGHRLGNHSDTHAHFPALTNAEIAADLARAEAAIVAASGGAGGAPLFRFPYGDRTSADIAAVNDAGYLPVRWTVDSLGWKGTSGGLTADAVVARVVGAERAGEIVLMHVGANPDDGTTLDADALPAIIDRLRTDGYTFTTLTTLLS